MSRAGAARRSVILALALSVAGPAGPAAAADLTPRTARAFDEYATAVEARIARELGATSRFLGFDFEDPALARAIRRDVLGSNLHVARLAARGRDAEAIAVPGGLINHWRGAILVPGLTAARAVALLRAPTDWGDRQEDVLESRLLWRDGDRSRVYLKLVRKKIVTVTYNTEHEVVYERRGPGRWTSRSIATRIAEVEGAGTPREREMPVGHDRGFMWRLNSYWRYEEVPGGVIVELESLTLSRDIPAVVKPLAQPIVDAIARESVARTLMTVRDRLLAAAPSAADRNR